MQTHQDRTEVAVTVDYPSDGGAVSPTSISYKVVDEEGDTLFTETVTPPSGELGTQVSVVIPAAMNTVPDSATRAARLVSFEFGTDGGTYVVQHRYIIEKATLLIPMTNSFQSYERAMLTRMSIARADGWDSAETSAQYAALTEAFNRMARKTYRYRLSQDAVAYDAHDPYWIVDRMSYRTRADYDKWPKDFKDALHLAQMYEANHILMGDPVTDKRRQGIISETIGEAKMFFNSAPPLRSSLCQEAMEVISPFLSTTRRIGRG